MVPRNIIGKASQVLGKVPEGVIKAIEYYRSSEMAIPLVIDGVKRYKNQVPVSCPYDTRETICWSSQADGDDLRDAIDASRKGKEIWNKLKASEKADIFETAVELVEGRYRESLLATTMLGQGKNYYQAEIDAICELGDFWNFNNYYRVKLANNKVPIDLTPTYVNSIKWVPLDGFVAAITPFNFTAIGGNLATAPLFMDNSVIWKPSTQAVLSNFTIYELLVEAGMPREAIQFVPGDPTLFVDKITESEDLASVAFTGSDKVFDSILKNVYGKIENYRSYPRVIGETGGYNYHLVLPDIKEYSDMNTIVDKTILGAFEYSGQKCSATSKLIVPNEHLDYYVERLSRKMARLQVGSPEIDDCFTSAVISEDSYNRASNFIHENSNKVLAGGKCDNSTGYYIYPTLLEDHTHELEKKYGEVFAPVLSIAGYSPDKDLEDTIQHINTSKYALTTGIFSNNQVYFNRFNNTCGNLYFNDKSTGSIVGQQIFGGFRKSGTNDKAGSEHLLTRFGNIQTTKFCYELREKYTALG